MNRRDHKFLPCFVNDCANCTSAYFGEDGEPVKCTCDCHGRKGSQVSMFAGAPKPSVQPELFAKVTR
jgi:hypothetical protein